MSWRCSEALAIELERHGITNALILGNLDENDLEEVVPSFDAVLQRDLRELRNISALACRRDAKCAANNFAFESRKEKATVISSDIALGLCTKGYRREPLTDRLGARSDEI